MNFKTTAILLVLLIVGLGVVIITRPHAGPEHAGDQSQTDQASVSAGGQRLMDVASDHVNGIGITDPKGQHTTLQKVGLTWHLLEPAVAPVVEYSVQDLIAAVVNVRSMGRPQSVSDSDAGLDQPRYRIDITTDDGTVIHFLIGQKTGIGDQMYAKIEGGEINLIDSSLERPISTAAVDVRDKHLFALKDAQIQQFRISQEGKTLAFAKVGGKWTIAEPKGVPGDDSAISTLLSSVTEIEATEFVPSGSDALAFAGFDHPTMTIWASAEAASTRPTTQPAGGERLTIGEPDSLLKEKYFAQTSDGTVAKIVAGALDPLRKSALDLRDKEIMMVDEGAVDKILISQPIFSATTGPSGNNKGIARPATGQMELVKLVRRAPMPLGPVLHGARPTTRAATRPQSTWQLADDGNAQVDDSKVSTLLNLFEPLRAEKFLESSPTGGIAKRWRVELTTRGSMDVSPITYRLEVTKPADGGNAFATYNGLWFEVPPSLVDSLEADYRAGAK